MKKLVYLIGLSIFTISGFAKEIVTAEVLFLQPGEEIYYSTYINGKIIAEGYFCEYIQKDNETKESSYSFLERLENGKGATYQGQLVFCGSTQH